MVNTPEKKQTIDVGTQIVASEKADAKDLAAATPEQQKKMEEPILDPSYLTEINKIKSDPQDIDPVQKENLAKLIEKKDYVGAIKEGFRLIGVLFKGGKGGPGLEQFTSIDEKLYKTRDEKTLTKHIEYLQKEIEGIS